MIKFKIDKKDYAIVDIRVRDLYVIMDKQWYSGHNAAVEIVAYLSGAPLDEVKKLKPHQFNPLWVAVENMFLPDPDAPVTTLLQLNGTDYGLLHMDELTVGEIADAELILHSPQADTRTHELLSILYRPVTGKWRNTYMIEEYDSKRCRERAEDFLDLDIKVMRGATAFFLKFANHCIADIAASLAKDLRKNPKAIPEAERLSALLLKSLESGQTSSTSAREKILSDLNKQLDLMLEQPSTLSPERETKPRGWKWNIRRWSTT